MALLEIRDLHASVAGKSILNGISLSVGKGEVHAIMGPNGSGKSTLGNVLMGSPKCTVSQGSALFNERDLLSLAPAERARAGLFVGFQHPAEIHGLKFHSFLKRAIEALKGEKPSVLEFRKILWQHASALNLPEDMDSRDVNYGLSGGEKKRAEVMQLSLLNPSLALLDEIDSGLDVDSIKIAAREVSNWASRNCASLILMTHYKRILDFIRPDFVHVMVGGRIARSGGAELADEVEANGYSVYENAVAPLAVATVPKEEFYTSLMKLNKEKAPHAGA